MWREHDMGSGGWIVMALVLIIIVALLVWLVLRTTGGDARDRRSPERGSGGGGDEPPLRILDRRLAEGKITVEDYEQRKKILAGDRGQPPG
jgi:uncharacterized membrane protein